MDHQHQLKRAAVLLSVIQFFFFTSWIVYVVYLGDLLEKVGLGRDLLIWFLIIAHVIFAISDTAMGYAADRMEKIMGMLGPAIVAVNALSCLAFMLLPFIAATGEGDSVLMQTLFIGLTLIWVATSSVLRAPPMVLLMKHAAQPTAPRLAALSLFGLALGGALSPYLGIVLKNIDPSIPFVITSLTLFATSTGLIYVQTLVTRMPKTPRLQGDDDKPLVVSAVSLLLIGSLFLAFGFQLHYFLNSKTQYLQFIPKEELVWFIPLFWVAFKLTIFPGSAAARHFGAIQTMAFATVMGGFGLVMVGLAKSLTILVIGQILVGCAWGIIFMAGISSALGLGRTGREGLVLGLWFTMLSVATFSQIVIGPSGLGENELFQALQNQIPLIFWLIGAMVLVGLAIINIKTLETRKI